MNTNLVGEVGVAYVHLELAKRGRTVILTPTLDFDILCSGGIRIEVKTSRPKLPPGSKRYYWHWGNHIHNRKWVNGGRLDIVERTIPRRRSCDYYVLVATDENLQNPRFFVLPKEVIENMNGTLNYPLDGQLTTESFTTLHQYENKWF